MSLLSCCYPHSLHFLSSLCSDVSLPLAVKNNMLIEKEWRMLEVASGSLREEIAIQVVLYRD